MGKHYRIDDGRIIVRPLAFLAPVGIALLLMFILMPLVTLLIILKGDLGQAEPKNFAAYFILFPMILGCIPLFTYSRRQIIFDNGSKSVEIKTIFGKRTLMSFANAGELTSRTSAGIGYYLNPKGDRYGKGTLVSPIFFGEQDKGKKIFDQEVLPAIRTMLRSAPSVAVENNKVSLYKAGVLEYYKQYFDGYLLKPRNVRKYIPAVIVCALVAVFGWYRYFTLPVLSETDKQMAFIPLIPILFLFSFFTKKIVFDKTNHKIKLYRFGIPFVTYSMDDFKGFNIVRKTHNGMYNGTDVRMRFMKEGSRYTRELTLEDFKKTASIEPFIKETEFVIGNKLSD